MSSLLGPRNRARCRTLGSSSLFGRVLGQLLLLALLFLRFFNDAFVHVQIRDRLRHVHVVLSLLKVCRVADDVGPSWRLHLLTFGLTMFLGVLLDVGQFFSLLQLPLGLLLLLPLLEQREVLRTYEWSLAEVGLASDTLRVSFPETVWHPPISAVLGCQAIVRDAQLLDDLLHRFCLTGMREKGSLTGEGFRKLPIANAFFQHFLTLFTTYQVYLVLLLLIVATHWVWLIFLDRWLRSLSVVELRLLLVRPLTLTNPGLLPGKLLRDVAVGCFDGLFLRLQLHGFAHSRDA